MNNQMWSRMRHQIFKQMQTKILLCASKGLTINGYKKDTMYRKIQIFFFFLVF